MPRRAFCSTCSRTVYVEIEDSLVCPVCSSPILEAINTDDDTELEPTGEPVAEQAQANRRTESAQSSERK